MLAELVKCFSVTMISHAIIMAYVMVKRVNAAKRMELQNIMVKVVKCPDQIHAIKIHVIMVERARPVSKQVFRSVS